MAHVGAGALVLYGRCDDELRVPYQPFAEALAWYCAGTPEPRFGRYAADLARLSDDITRLESQVGDALRADPESEQYRLFEAVRSWLSDVSNDTQVVLVLDDIHWAAKPTLMLRYLLGRLADTPLFVCATYRDTDIAGSPLATVVGDFRRLTAAHVVEIGGLGTHDVRELVAARGGSVRCPTRRRVSPGAR